MNISIVQFPLHVDCVEKCACSPSQIVEKFVVIICLYTFSDSTTPITILVWTVFFKFTWFYAANPLLSKLVMHILDNSVIYTYKINDIVTNVEQMNDILSLW